MSILKSFNSVFIKKHNTSSEVNLYKQLFYNKNSQKGSISPVCQLSQNKS